MSALVLLEINSQLLFVSTTAAKGGQEKLRERDSCKKVRPSPGSAILAEVKEDFIDKESDSVDWKCPQGHGEGSPHEHLGALLAVAVSGTLDHARVVAAVSGLHTTLDHVERQYGEPAQGSREPSEDELCRLRGICSATRAQL